MFDLERSNIRCGNVDNVHIRRLDSFEMWCWRKMLKVRWIDRKTNNWVLKEAGEKRSLVQSIRKRKTSMARPRSKTRWPPEGSHRRETSWEKRAWQTKTRDD